MAQVAAFRGIRYDQSRIEELSKVTTPPYDVISPEDRIRYHELHPNNFVRLILGEEFEGDNRSENRFSRAGRYLKEWLDTGVLVEDAQPAIYVYRQEFDGDGGWKTVTGLVAAVKLQGYSEKVILPHETTLAKPKSELLELMRRTWANLDSIYGLYSDEERKLDELIDRTVGEPALEEAVDKNGVRHALWSITDNDKIRRIEEFFLSRRIAIADGHHRYETALAFRDEMRRTMVRTIDEMPWDRALMTLVSVNQNKITVFPTHRAIGELGEGKFAGLDDALAEDFAIESSTKKRLLSDMAAREAIGMYQPGKAVTLKVNEESRGKMSGSQASRGLELNVLHELVLHRALGIDEEDVRNQTHIRYTRDADEAMELVDRGERQVVFLLNNIPVKTVLDVALAGERMPQKATYFYPKLLSGLVLRKM